MKWRIILILIILTITGGIANYKELNELAIVSSMAIEKAENGDYIVSVQVMNSKKGDSGSESSSSQSKITVYTREDKTVQAALRLMINESPKKLHLAHLKFLVISEELAKEGIDTVLDFFLRNTDVNYEIVLLIAKEGSSPSDIISTLTPVEMNPSTNIYDSLDETCKYEGTAVKNTLYRAIDEIMNDYDDALISSVEIIGDEEDGKSLDNIEDSVPKTKVIVSDIAYFDDKKMAGYLSQNDAKVYNMISNNMKNTILQLNKDGIELAFELLENKCKTDVSIEGENIDIKMSFKIIANLVEARGKLKIKTEEELSKLEDTLALEVTNMVNEYLNNVKTKYMVDVSGFGDMLYKKYNKKFIKISEDYLNKINFNVEVKVSLENEGSVINQW